MFELNNWEHGAGWLNVAVGPDNGPPLVLLHGVLRSWSDFAPLWSAFAPRWRLHALDLRGHGGSAGIAPHYRVMDYVEDIAAYCAQLERRPVLYGHSLGALVAAATAARLPDRVQGVILEDPPGPALLGNLRASPYFAMWSAMQKLAEDEDSVAALAAQLAEISLPGPTGVVRLGDVRDATALRYSARCLSNVDPAVLTPLLAGRWLDGYDMERIFAEVMCPALVLRGEERLGGMLGRSEAEALVGRMPDGMLVDVAGAGHLIHWQATETTVRLCLGFLESLW